MASWNGPAIGRFSICHRSPQLNRRDLVAAEGGVSLWARSAVPATFPLGGSVSRNLRTEPATIPARGRFPISMETVRLSYLIPRIFVSTDLAALATCS